MTTSFHHHHHHHHSRAGNPWPRLGIHLRLYRKYLCRSTLTSRREPRVLCAVMTMWPHSDARPVKHTQSDCIHLRYQRYGPPRARSFPRGTRASGKIRRELNIGTTTSDEIILEREIEQGICYKLDGLGWAKGWATCWGMKPATVRELTEHYYCRYT